MKTFKMGALILVVVLGMTFAIGCDRKSTTTTPIGQVTFPDSNLEASVRKTLNISRRQIYISDLKFLFSLDAHGRSISDLTGLEYCVNLSTLTLSENNISDISALAGLTNLWGLDLRDNNIGDISALAGLDNLELLFLSGNNISDISVLAGLTNLWGLDLRDNSIGDISAFVTNNGLSAGDIVQLQNNPLSIASLNIYIPQLREKGIILSPIRCDTF